MVVRSTVVLVFQGLSLDSERQTSESLMRQRASLVKTLTGRLARRPREGAGEQIRCSTREDADGQFSMQTS